ncbi:MAG TPA: glycosyltransferase family 39 protein, partial [Gammaproteobacteria bacterium]|nr:glycosyltransferase family 39 protein [Gammaproteobacteria bacterium]
VLTGSIVFTAFGPWVQIDLLLVLCTLLAMSGMLVASRGGYTGWLLTGVAIGLGALSKGPVILIPVLPPAMLAPWWLRTRPAAGWGAWYAGLLVSLIAGVALALAWAIPAAEAGGETYREAIFWGQTADRLAQSFAHAHPFWWYLPWLPVLLAPWSLLPWMWSAVRHSRPLQDAGIRFCIAWLAGGFVLLSLVSGKQIKYLLPLLPAAALMLGRVLSRMGDISVHQRPWLPAAMLLLLGIVLMLLPLNHEQAAWFRWVSPLWGGLLVILAVVLAGLPPLRPLQYPQMMASLAAAVVVLLQVGLFREAAPAYDLRAASRFVAAAQADGRRVGAVTSYHGQFGFYGRLSRPVQLIEPGQELAWARSHPGGYLAISGRHLTREPADAAFSQPYRGGYLAIVDGETLLRHPELLP